MKTAHKLKNFYRDVIDESHTAGIKLFGKSILVEKVPQSSFEEDAVGIQMADSSYEAYGCLFFRVISTGNEVTLVQPEEIIFALPAAVSYFAESDIGICHELDVKFCWGPAVFKTEEEIAQDVADREEAKRLKLEAIAKAKEAAAAEQKRLKELALAKQKEEEAAEEAEANRRKKISFGITK